MNYDKDSFKSLWRPAESLSLKMYRCPAGYLSIGWGHNLETNPISPRVAAMMLDDDIAAAEKLLVRALPWVEDLSPVRQMAMLELAMNMGIGDGTHGLLSFTTTLANIKAGRWQDAAGSFDPKKGLRGSKWYQDVKATRAERVIRMLVTGRVPE